MATRTTGTTESRLEGVDLERWAMRRRWARVAWVYGALVAFGTIFVGVFIVAYLASLKTNPLEWPFEFRTHQLDVRNWGVAAQQGREGAGDMWFGGFAPGGVVTFEVEYFAVTGRELEEPVLTIPRRAPGSRLVAQRARPFAADYAVVLPMVELERRDGAWNDVEGAFVRYLIEIRYEGDGPVAERLPVDLESAPGLTLVDSTLPPDRIERRGRVASWDSIAPGFFGYAFRNYVRVFRSTEDMSGRSLFWTWTLNSTFVSTVRVITTVLFGAMAGYALARMRFAGRELVFLLVLFSMMVPPQVLFISNYLVLRDGIFGLTQLFGIPTLLNNLWGVIIGGVGVSGLITASAVFIMKQFFESIPREIEEAALIDGASPPQTFFRVILPMATPALGAITILTFQGTWNEFFWPFVVLTDQRVKTLPLGLYSFQSAYGQQGDWGLILAGAFLSMVPIIILFVVFQRYFIEGVSFSGLKG